MRRCRDMIDKARELGRKRGLRSQEVQRDRRLAAAIDYCAPKDHLIFEMATRSARTGTMHYLEIWHEKFGGTNRFAVYVDGEKWRNGWSRTRFCEWVFKQIDSVRTDWE